MSRAYGGAATRGPLGTYNFAGDLGKAALPALTALLLALMPWRPALWLLALLGLLAAIAIRLLVPTFARAAAAAPAPRRSGGAAAAAAASACCSPSACSTALCAWASSSSCPSCSRRKARTCRLWASPSRSLFLGGAAGKFACGWLGARLGMLATVLATEIGTAMAILVVLALPLAPALALLPLLGIMLNGTSSVLYGTVPEWRRRAARSAPSRVFYTGTIGSGALAPVLYGVLGDLAGPGWGAAAAAATALLTCPLALLLAPKLRPAERHPASPDRHRPRQRRQLRNPRVPLGQPLVPRPPRLGGEAEIEVAQRAADRDLADGPQLAEGGRLALQRVHRPRHHLPLPRDEGAPPLIRRKARLAPARHGRIEDAVPERLLPQRRPARRRRPAGNSRGASPRLSRYSQITGLSKSAVPSSSISAGTLDSGFTPRSSGGDSCGLVATFSMRPSSPRAIAQAMTLRT